MIEATPCNVGDGFAFATCAPPTPAHEAVKAADTLPWPWQSFWAAGAVPSCARERFGGTTMRYVRWLALLALLALAPAGARAADPAPAARPVDPALKKRCAAAELAPCVQAITGILFELRAPSIKEWLVDTVKDCEAPAPAIPREQLGARCFTAAWGLTFPEPSVRDDAASARFARKACDLGDRRGCALLGLAMVRGRGVKRDPAEGVKLLGSTCLDRDPREVDGISRACWFLGVHLARGASISRDLPAATEALDRACRGSRRIGHLGGGAWRIPYACRDLKRVSALSDKGEDTSPVGLELDRDDRELITNGILLDECEGGDLDACAAASSGFFQSPDGYPKELLELAKLLELARAR
jgi:hypothetical protein